MHSKTKKKDLYSIIRTLLGQGFVGKCIVYVLGMSDSVK